jgi:hypothetical protein
MVSKSSSTSVLPYRAMLRMAYKDLNALTGMLDKSLFAYEIFGFHVQQAVEKALFATRNSHL